VRVADLHCDTLLELQGGASLEENKEGHVDLPRLAQGEVALQVFVAFVSTNFPVGQAFREAMALLDLLDDACARFPAHLRKCVKAVDVERASVEGRIAAVPALENGHAIESDLKKLETLAGRGVRYMTLTHSVHLPWAASSGDTGDGPGGLTGFGREVVAAMRALGMLVDVSHVHEKTFWDVVRKARKPVIASHSCAAKLCPGSRNLTDDQMKAIADTGGLIGINFYPGFLDPRYFARLGGSIETLFRYYDEAERAHLDDPLTRMKVNRQLTRKWRERVGTIEADLDTICDHVEHVRAVAGEDCVALGSDFDGVPDLPRDLPDCSALPALLERLRARGTTEGQLRKLAWDNVVRVLREAE
jgi:membrane dipeptidase